MKPPLSANAWLRYDVIRLVLAGIRGTSFLEVGAGGGALAARLVDDYEYVGYEPDPASAALAQLRLAGRGRFVESTLPPVPERLFDIVGAFEVLEHIRDDELALREWSRWIAPGGHLLVSVPSNPDRWGHADLKVGHIRRYTRAELHEKIAAAGLDVVRIHTIGFPLGYALEAVRNVLARREIHGSLEARTAASGRWMQPGNVAGIVTEWGTAPFRWVQRRMLSSDLGTGLLAVARQPHRTSGEPRSSEEG